MPRWIKFKKSSIERIKFYRKIEDTEDTQRPSLVLLHIKERSERLGNIVLCMPVHQGEEFSFKVISFRERDMYINSLGMDSITHYMLIEKPSTFSDGFSNKNKP